MPMWPFGRRGGKATKIKESGPSAVAERKRPVAGSMSQATTRKVTGRDKDVVRREASRRSSRRRRRRSRSTSASMRDVVDVEKHSPTSQPQPLEPAVVFTHEELDLPGPRHAAAHHRDTFAALPAQRPLDYSPHLRPISQQRGPAQYNFHSHSQSHPSLPTARERGKLQRPQSLRKIENESSAFVRRRSTKKQKREHEHLREEEIRAMSMPLPQKRPAGSSGGTLRRDSKKVKASVNHRLERPDSNGSLPTDESIHSSMSGSSDPRAFRVSALDMLAPRPTVRCSVGSQYYSSTETSPLSRKVRPYNQQSWSRETQPEQLQEKRARRTSRIDDLADELDAGALRDILERDKRRRERKRKAEDERLRRRLERRAEKQRAADGTPRSPRTPTTPRREGSGTIGLGIVRDTSTPMEGVQPSTPQHRPPPLKPRNEQNSQLPTPLDSPVETPVVSNAQAVRYSRGSVSAPVHTRGSSNVSQMPELLSERLAQETRSDSVERAHELTASGSLHAVDTVDTAATSKKSGDRRRSSEGRRMAIFASLFRRGKRRSQDQGRTTPSEASFSNTSRESMARQPIPAHLVGPPLPTPTAPITINRPSNAPRRTRSKFKEDLPEFTPPHSRVQSPEIIHNSAIAARRGGQPPADLRIESDSSGAARNDSPVSPGVPNAGVMSQSMASVDSEGSWLSGKPMKRNSKQSQMRSSGGSSSVLKTHEPFNASYEELGIPDDEYFRRLTTQPDERRQSLLSGQLLQRKPSSTLMSPLDTAGTGGSDEGTAPPTVSRISDEEEEVVHSVERRPTVIHRQNRVKSREGLMSFYNEDKPSVRESGSSAEPVEGESPTSEVEPVVQRARSIDLGKHHLRHLSAGSAKLLEIQKRSSTSSQNKLTEQEE